MGFSAPPGMQIYGTVRAGRRVSQTLGPGSTMVLWTVEDLNTVGTTLHDTTTNQDRFNNPFSKTLYAHFQGVLGIVNGATPPGNPSYLSIIGTGMANYPQFTIHPSKLTASATYHLPFHWFGQIAAGSYWALQSVFTTNAVTLGGVYYGECTFTLMG